MILVLSDTPEDYANAEDTFTRLSFALVRLPKAIGKLREQLLSKRGKTVLRWPSHLQTSFTRCTRHRAKAKLFLMFCDLQIC